MQKNVKSHGGFVRKKNDTILLSTLQWISFPAYWIADIFNLLVYWKQVFYLRYIIVQSQAVLNF